MKALVYNGPGHKAWEEVPDADDPGQHRRHRAGRLHDHLRLRPPHLEGGRSRGDRGTHPRPRGRRHRRVRRLRGDQRVPGDRVLVSCISACGRCRYCREGRYGQCLGGGGWILGHLIDGTQAEYVRVPFADTSTYKVPEGVSDEEILMLADILPTAYEVGVLNGHVQPGDTVAVVGAGPIGLSAIRGAQLYSPSHIIAIDLADSRLEAAKLFGPT